MMQRGETTFLDGKPRGGICVEGAIKGIGDPHCDNTTVSTDLMSANDGNSNTVNVVSVPTLVPEIIMDIVSRLPIVDIVRFKVVSKGSNNMTKDPLFIEMHLMRALRLPPCLIVEPNVKSAINNLYLIDRGNGIWRGQEVPIGNTQWNYMFTLTSCHGLLCVAGMYSEIDPLFIYNPITKESIELPKTNSGLGKCYYSVGFGFDSKIKKYKVVRLLKVYRKGNPNTYMKCEIITVGEVSWRELEASHQVVCSAESKPVFLDDSLHWIIDTDVHPGRDRILVLDLCDETFHTIKFPSSLIRSIKYPLELFLMNFRGSLTLVEHSYYEQIDQWRIARSNTNTSGYKFYHSSHTMTIPYKACIGDMRLKEMLMDNSLLFHVRLSRSGEQHEEIDHIALYNAEQGHYRIVDVSGIPKSFYAVLVVPSLVSPSAAFSSGIQEANLK